MKYCLDFNKHSPYMAEADELNIIYDAKDRDLVQFLKDHASQRINLTLRNLEEALKNKEIERIFVIREENPELNISIKIPYYDRKNENLTKSLEIIKNKIPFYFDTLVNDWDTFLGMINLGVSDIYIVEELGFQLDKISSIAHKNNIQIRCFPNVCQTEWAGTDVLKTFFIRPEDVQVYEPYVDVLEFWGIKTKQDTYFEIYSKDKKWFGPLNEILIGFENDLDSRFTIPRFAERRISCNRQCLKGGNCHICDRIWDLSKTLQSANLFVDIEEDKTSN